MDGASVLADPRRRWHLALDPARGIVHLGLDSEGTGREATNLLAGPPTITWDGAGEVRVHWRAESDMLWRGDGVGTDGGEAAWTIARDGDDLAMRFENRGAEDLVGLALALPFDPLMAAATLIPSAIDESRCGRPPWLLVAPDFGHLLVQPEPTDGWHAIASGIRRGSPRNAPRTGVDPRLRGRAWMEASGLPDYVPSTLRLVFSCAQPLAPGRTLAIRFRPAELTTPEGIDPAVWRRIRRPWLNHWQPCGDWAGRDLAFVLANNVLSDPAACSLWFYAEPMLFSHEPVPGIDVRRLLRHTLDHWLDQAVSYHGHVNAFGRMFDLYVFTGAALLVAAWVYWVTTGDGDWLAGRIGTLHRMADYLLRRDVDGDGLVESHGSGNAGTLRDPDRADVWFEMMNFGHKNAWTNLLAWRAFLCVADMLEAHGEPGGAAWYRSNAARLRDSFRRRVLGPNGWFASWVSLDGDMHDYCHTFINGMAVAWGMVGPMEGRAILSRVAERSRAIGFDQWHLGVPANLLPCRKADMIGPRIGIDGSPARDDFAWPDGMTEETAFGYRYPNGTIHPTLVWPYLLGLQVAGLDGEANRILDAMIGSAEEGLFQNGAVNCGYGGAEHFTIDGHTCGYEGYLPESYNFLMAAFTREPAMRARLLAPMARVGDA